MRKRKTNCIVIFDTTLRDGEQCPGASMNLREKLEVARQLKRLGADVIEAGFPVISEGDFASVQEIARKVKGPIICGLARCKNRDIDAAGQALKPAGKKARIHVFIGTSPIHRKNLSRDGKTQDEVLQMAVEGVKRARAHVSDVEFSAMDATRTEPDFLIQICKAAVLAGATTINIPDTVGYAMPEEFGALIARLMDEIPECKSGKAVISVHCHNDLGRAVDNSLAAIKAGAKQVECTVNGIGERAGNAALEEVVMNLFTRADYFEGLYTKVNIGEIVRSSRLVARMSGLAVQRSKAIVGENAFAHASGIHQDGILKKREAFEIIDPTTIGWGVTELPLTKHSGRAAVSARLKHLGFKMTETDSSSVFARFKEIGDKKKFVSDDDLAALVEGQIAQVPETWSLQHLQMYMGTGQVPTATVRLKNCTGTKEDAGTGGGPVDAVLKVIDRLTEVKGKIMDYSIHAVSPGKDAIGEVVIEVDFGDEKPVKGRHADTNIVEASARAYLNAVNRHLQSKKRE